MDIGQFEAVLRDLAECVDLPSPDPLLKTRALDIEGFEVRFEYFEADPAAMYVNFHYGTVTAGRTLALFRLMLEANLLIYAQDQAQLGLDSDTGGTVLILRLGLTHELNGEVLVETMEHYAEHGRYWRKNIIEASDEMFAGIVSGDYKWLKA